MNKFKIKDKGINKMNNEMNASLSSNPWAEAQYYANMLQYAYRIGLRFSHLIPKMDIQQFSQIRSMLNSRQS